MAGEGGLRWLVREGRLRAFWRLLLFVLLFLVLFQVLAVLLIAVAGAPSLPDQLAGVLLLQAAAMLGAAVAAGWILLRWVDRRPLAELGFALERRVPRDLVAGTAIGAAALAGATLVLVLAGAVRFTGAPGSMPEWLGVMGAALLFFALPAAAEEAVFRGYPFRTLVEATGAVAATLIMSLLFALVHGLNPNVATYGMVNIFAAGVMLSLAVLWTGSLWFATAVHLGWNWAMAGPLDLPVSGLELFDAPLYDAVATGPGWLTGGMFGPEGGLAGSLAVVLAIALMWWYTRGGAARGRAEAPGDAYVDNR